jgi:puromycin-sensitive aminopeptidase
LNSVELKFNKAVLEYTNGTKMSSCQVNLDEEKELATIVFGETINKGTAKLYIDYIGLLNDKLKGFYRSKYMHSSGEERYSASTQFEVNKKI